MQKAFTFKDVSGVVHAGILETTDELYRKIIIDENNIPLLIVKGVNYYYSTPYSGKLGIPIESWYNMIPLTKEARRILVLGDSSGFVTLSLLLSYGYKEGSKIYYCNPFGHPDEKQERDHESLRRLTTETLVQHGIKGAIQIYPEYSRNFLPTVKRAILDIAYIDLNSEPRWLLEDLVLVWRKVKQNGYIVIANYGQGVQQTVSAFLTCYDKHTNVIGCKHNLLFIQKTQEETSDAAVFHL
jgi:hypothetical protein